MVKKAVSLLAFILLTVPLFAQVPSPAPLDKQVGYALIDAVSQLFQKMAATGTGGAEVINKAVEGFMADARKAKDKGRIDGVFFVRYTRILAIIKIAAAPDPQGILVPMFDGELGRFIREVLGEDYKGTGPGAIGQVANAIADELVNLHLYLDDIETKEKLRKAWDEKMRPAGN